MMNKFLILWLVIVPIFNTTAQTYRDSANNLTIVRALSNTDYINDVLKEVYIPTDAGLSLYSELMVTANNILSDRYGCTVEFFDYSETDSINDPLFMISKKEGTTLGFLILPISIVEEFHQKGSLIDQVDKFGYYSDMMILANE